ncbi:MAG: LLM class flavin-dependent oxidoreductase [Opitutales bacterium]
MKFGLDTFGDMTVTTDGHAKSAAQVIRDVSAQAQLADQLGIDHFNVGEHHRDDYAVSAPDMVLAGIAGVTKDIQLGTAVTVLSSEDPVRVFQRFSTLDALSNGRAEITVGRGSFTESFPLFGYELKDYEILFEEKFDLLLKLLEENEVTWSGTTRGSLDGLEVYPKTEKGKIPMRRGVGGSPQSVYRTAEQGLAIAFAIIGGDPIRFAGMSQVYKQALEANGHAMQSIGIHSPGHIAATDEQAAEELWPHYAKAFGRIGRERGWGPMSMEHFVAEVKHGSLYVGSPETVAQKIAYAIEAVGADRFDLKYATGPMPHEHLMQSIELYGTQVIPRVKEILAEKQTLKKSA